MQTLIKKQAFTLIELLVVIVIIGILSAIGITTFNGGKERAYDARKQQNLNQINKILTLFSLENSDVSMKFTCDISGENIVYQAGRYYSGGEPVPEGSHAACLVKYLKEQGMEFPNRDDDCVLFFHENAGGDSSKFLITSASDFAAGDVYFYGNSEAKNYIDPDGASPFSNNYINLLNYTNAFISVGCKEYGLNALNIYRSAPYGGSDYVNVQVEPLDPDYFD